MSKGYFITFEGTDGGGKSTQTGFLAETLRGRGYEVRTICEPGGTLVRDEIRYILKHSIHGKSMTPEAELLMMDAARAQLVREVIHPALADGEIVLCDRFYHSAIDYQWYGRQIDLRRVEDIIDFAVGNTGPYRIYFLHVPIEVGEERRRAGHLTGSMVVRKCRFDAEDREFFRKVEEDYKVLTRADTRIKCINAGRNIEKVREEIWQDVRGCLSILE